MANLIPYLFSIPIVLIALTCHEFAHGYVAYKLGDPTARNLGRLTLNPLKHLDPIGALCMVLLRFGWARPVPITTRNFKKPKRDMALTAIAGPLANLVLSFFSLVIVCTLIAVSRRVLLGDFAMRVLEQFLLFFYLSHLLNLSLCVFNLIPIPPLDGSRILSVVLPYKIYYSIMKYERYIMIGLMLALLLGVRFGFIGTIVDFISGGMMRLLLLIPFFQ